MSNSSSNGGISVGVLLGILFVALKLTGHIDWSWWFVTMPFWIGFALFFLIAVVGFFAEIFYRWNTKQRKT